MPEFELIDQAVRQQVVDRFNAIGGRCACASELANEINAPHLTNQQKLNAVLDVLQYFHQEHQLERVVENEDPFSTLYSAPWTVFG